MLAPLCPAWPKMARLVTVHLLVAEASSNEPGTRYDAPDGFAERVRAVLDDALARGVLLDWGYANGGHPTNARHVLEFNYQPQAFYKTLGLERPG